MNWRSKLSLATAALVALAVVGVAYATIPNDGVINGCYKTSGGTLRVIDGSVTSCRSNETALKWNVQGAQGPQGAQGEPGISLFAVVDQDGTLSSGTATEVEQEFDGHYVVTFDRDVTDCAATASLKHPDAVLSTHATIAMGGTSNDQVLVTWFTDSSLQNISTGFHLIVAC